MTYRCRGYTLIELLVVISITGVLMVLIGEWIHLTMKFSSSLRQRQQHHQNLSRLAKDLRDDVRQSEAIELQLSNRLVINQGDGVIAVYEIRESSVRIEKRRNGELVLHDTFELERSAIVDWDDSELPGWISLVVLRGSRGPMENPDAVGSLADGDLREDGQSPVDLYVRVGPHRWNRPVVKASTTERESADE